MSKIKIDPKPFVYPIPAAMVSCRNSKGEDNIITIAWIGTVASEPPTLSISIRPQRYSFDMIMESKEFVVNLTSENVVFETDYCGVRSGRHENKFEKLNLAKIEADIVNAPLIKECPVNLECKVKKVEDLGSHHMFIAEIVAIHVDEELYEGDNLNLEKAKLISYVNGSYCKLGDIIDIHAYSIKRK